MIMLVLVACPKCGTDAARVSRGACSKCGLRVDLWGTFDGTPPADPLLDPAFAALVSRWDERSAHEAFIALAQRAGLLDAAAARYQSVLRERPSDDEARAAITQIALIVTHQPQVAIRFTDDTLRTVRIVSTVLAFIIAICVGLILVRVFRG